MSRTKIAFIVAPLWVPLAAALVFRLVVWRDPAQAHWVVIGTVISAIFAYGGSCLLGLPLFRWLSSKGLVSMWIAPAVGFVIGAVTWLAFMTCFTIFLGEGPVGAASSLAPQQLSFLFLPGGLGALVGMTLWLIARPDRHTPANV
jgi:hypothetical protein